MRRDKHQGAEEFLNCKDCQKRNPSAVRATFNCGFMAVSKRKGPGFPQQPGWPERTCADDYEHQDDYFKACRSEVCVGYLIRLPQVFEAARALKYWETGTLSARYEGAEIPGPAMDSCEELNGAINDVQRYAMEKARD